MKLVQLNIERNNHIERFVPFLQKENADVVCLQEVTQSTFDVLQTQLGYQGIFAPMTTLKNFEPGTDGETLGIVMLSKHPFDQVHKDYYVGDGSEMRLLERGNSETYVNGLTRILTARIPEIDPMRVYGLLRFTWSERGQNTETQKRHLDALFAALDERQPDVLTGDFNIPRGTELYAHIASRYRDNVPAEVVSTLDQELHRKHGLKFVVDYV